jgi:hypothetical protein
MTKYAKERIWRAPDGKLISESEVKDGQSGGLGTALAYAAGDAIEGDDEEHVPSKLATSKAPETAAPVALATAAGTTPVSGPTVTPTSTTPVEPSPAPAPTKKELLARAAELGIEDVSEKTTNADLSAAIAEAEAKAAAEEGGS